MALSVSSAEVARTPRLWTKGSFAVGYHHQFLDADRDAAGLHGKENGDSRKADTRRATADQPIGNQSKEVENGCESRHRCTQENWCALHALRTQSWAWKISDGFALGHAV